MTTKWDTYQKCINVIDSCKTLEQANNAYKYCLLMYKKYEDYQLITNLYNRYTEKKIEILKD